MWTPKRILIYLAALTGFFAVFVGVVIFIPVDNLPPLPPHFVDAGDVDHEGYVPPIGIESERDFKLRQAFGNECEELKRKSLIWLPSKGAVLAINKFEIERDGRVKLTPFSVGLFPKNSAAKRFPEINTVQCEYALLTLDRPVTGLSDLGRSKVVGVELGGERGVKITNNRGSQEKNDDLELYVTEKQLFYEDARNLIWSNGYIKLLDTQSRPLPTQVTAVGMEVHLKKDSGAPKPPPTPKGDAKKVDGVSGVESIALLANVDMHLYTDAGTGFLSSPTEPRKAATPKAGADEKAHIHIKTNGKFVHDVVKDTARFDAPEQSAQARDRVVVTRHVAAKASKDGIVTDLLDCDRLDLQFRKKAADAAGGGNKEIDSAIATAKTGAIVELHLEGEELHAFGVEMRYYAAAATAGPRTILKGAPMHAIRQGHQIQCDELHLKGADKAGAGQEAFAKGPGKIDLLDKKTGKSPTHILFKNSFTATKDKDGDRVYDLLTLRGDAAFIDDEQKQELRAVQFLHVWLEEVKNDPAKATPAAAAKDAPPPKKDDSNLGQKTRIHKIEGFDKVQVRSPELNIRDANHLTVIFREKKIVRPSGAPVPVLPAIGPAAGGPTPAAAASRDNAPAAKEAPAAGAAKSAAEKPKRPLEIAGSEITVQIATFGNAKELLEFIADGNVHVSQAAENPKDKGLDIVGSMLNLVREPGGDILYVFGEPKKLAQLQQNEMLLFGPKVTINQVENVANVDGVGAMHMPSNTTLDGKKKDGHITVHWNKSMWFNGRSADFDGGVEAFQGNGKIRCNQMQVTFDKPVDFKQTKGAQTAKVDKILCNGREDQKVFILDEERDKDNKIVNYRRLLLAVVEIDNLEQRVNGSGPGVIDTLGRSAPGDPALAPKKDKEPPKVDPKADEEKILKWTRVRFEGQMISSPTAGGAGRQTTFLDQVRVYHQPGEDPNLRDPTTIGPGGLFFTCQKLTIVQRKSPEGKNSQQMFADGMSGMVNFQTEEFHGTAKAVKYDDAQEQIIFEGIPGAPATLYKRPKVQGGQPERIQGTKILYNRKTGEFLLDGVRVISSWLTPPEMPWTTAAVSAPRFRPFEASFVGLTRAVDAARFGVRAS